MLDSRAALQKAGAAGLLGSGRGFFYLDAHWNADLPLREEVSTILEHCPDYVIAIDDFHVPHDEGFGYDDYGPGARLDVSYLEPALAGDSRVFLPGYSSENETGARRGIAIVCKEGEIAEWARGDARLLQVRPEV